MRASRLLVTASFFHLGCPKVKTAGAPAPRLRVAPPRTGWNPVFVCPRCKITIVVSTEVDVR